MESILTSNVPDKYNQNRHFMRGEHKSVSPRHRFVLALHLAGVQIRDKILPDGSVKQGIMTLTGYKEAAIHRILNDKGVIALRQQHMQHLDQEFEAQYRKVVDALDVALDEEQPTQVKLQAAKLWGDFHKKFSGKEPNQQQINVTAEDVVFQIMNQPQS